MARLLVLLLLLVLPLLLRGCGKGAPARCAWLVRGGYEPSGAGGNRLGCLRGGHRLRLAGRGAGWHGIGAAAQPGGRGILHQFCNARGGSAVGGVGGQGIGAGRTVLDGRNISASMVLRQLGRAAHSSSLVKVAAGRAAKDGLDLSFPSQKHMIDVVILGCARNAQACGIGTLNSSCCFACCEEGCFLSFPQTRIEHAEGVHSALLRALALLGIQLALLPKAACTMSPSEPPQQLGKVIE